MGLDVIHAISHFFQSGRMPTFWNTSTITLIPKVQCPARPSDYQPISCFHVFYKCIFKLIHSRLRLVLGDIIDHAQGAFVAGRSIMHNILLCQDLVKHYTRKNCAPSCLMKIDLCKAYDSLNWQFIKEMLIVLNFPHQFIKIVMACNTSTGYVF